MLNTIRNSREAGPCSRAHHRTASGFTLIEMLVVLLIAGILISLVALSPSLNRKSGLNEEAQRLATMLASADDEAQVRSARIAWEPIAGGYRFVQATESGGWAPIRDDLLKPHRWGVDITRVGIEYTGGHGSPTRIVFGEESISVPVTITLSAGDTRLEVISTGIGSFAVRQP
ncbi:GspH/FimT family pseudopilin [Pararobbsia alpina]|uniref:GspH/FimT family pseudopilin n=1 Tax=Pararobbsia alpina TaxID=621374 RepID=UPI0039A58EB1